MILNNVSEVKSRFPRTSEIFDNMIHCRCKEYRQKLHLFHKNFKNCCTLCDLHSKRKIAIIHIDILHGVKPAPAYLKAL